MIDSGHPPVAIAIGYSVRALIEACWYAGLECVAVDHFGDSDTRGYANDRWIELRLTERGLLLNETRHAIHATATASFRAGKKVVFVLAGGMENLGGVVEELREIAPVLGPTEHQRLALRDIAFLDDVARGAGLRTPQLRYDKVSDGGWLWKPSKSAGGLRIVRSGCAVCDLESGYWQQYIGGEQIGIFCVIGPSGCEILGATSSFDAADWPGPSEFIYRGSIGPIALTAECRSRIECMCQKIRDSIGFCGCLQFDFIRDPCGGLWLLECNPRWTAGMEICLFAGGVNPVRGLFAINNLSVSNRTVDQGGVFECYAKAIVYATQPIIVTGELIAELNRIEGVADRPFAPQLIECGHPVATVRAGLKCGDANLIFEESRTLLLDELWRRAERVKSIIGD